MTSFDPGLLLPPREEEEIYPYRRAWRSIALESGILLGITAALFIIFNLFGVRLPERLQTPVSLTLALTPVGLWMVFSWWQERFVPQPRQHLIMVMVVSALAANAVGIPLVNDVLQVDRWLPLSSAIMRIIGYTFTVGIIQETLKYLVVRYIAWPGSFRSRLDGVAYGAAAAVGYATVLNLHIILTTNPPPDSAALRIFSTIAVNLVASAIVGYGLAEVRFGQPSPFFLTITIALAAFVTGVAIPVRAGLVNASLSLDIGGDNPLLNISATRPLFGLVFSSALLIAPSLALSVLFNSAERREREAGTHEA